MTNKQIEAPAIVVRTFVGEPSHGQTRSVPRGGVFEQRPVDAANPKKVTYDAWYEMELTRIAPDGIPETRTFCVLQGLSKEAALAMTLAEPDVFWR